ncbi:MAG: class I SAM-dependent methyltransferase [Bacteroidia bacterium]|jgi:2-polyprenyl-3-methyl-5-hydroxy-6-metoxy-1,4-benzoquinol methylase|nr:class I SAM-dependent methyltransferase [Bacteroidia bacterium]
MIDYISPKTKSALTENQGFLLSEEGEKFPIIHEIPRFVESNNYASAFGLQWKTFTKTQLDSEVGLPVTKDRVERCLGYPLSELKNKTLLEVGCGAGRFTELLVNSGANVHAVDLSVAVEANLENIGQKSNYKVAQASVYDLPFPDNSFEIVFCLGVIQHTPDPEKTIAALWSKVKTGGILVIDHYKWRIGYYSTLTPLYREWLRKLKPEKSIKIVDKLVNFFFPLHWKLKDNNVLQWMLHRVSPLIHFIYLFPDKDYNFHKEISKLDTYDSLTDYYKHLRTPAQIKNTLEQLGAKDIWINEGGNGVEARCKK